LAELTELFGRSEKALVALDHIRVSHLKSGQKLVLPR